MGVILNPWREFLASLDCSSVSNSTKAMSLLPGTSRTSLKPGNLGVAEGRRVGYGGVAEERRVGCGGGVEGSRWDVEGMWREGGWDVEGVWREGWWGV